MIYNQNFKVIVDIPEFYMLKFFAIVQRQAP